jgi:hypothetical protein
MANLQVQTWSVFEAHAQDPNSIVCIASSYDICEIIDARLGVLGFAFRRGAFLQVEDLERCGFFKLKILMVFCQPVFLPTLENNSFETTGTLIMRRMLMIAFYVTHQKILPCCIVLFPFLLWLVRSR